jgi:hypothetical protein
MVIVLWTIYALSFVPHWYDDRWSVVSIDARPNLINSPNKALFFMLLNAALRYGVVIGLWFCIGWKWAVAALVIHCFIGWRLSRHYVQKAIKHYGEMFIRTHANDGLSDRELEMAATRFAVRTIFQHTKGKPTNTTVSREEPL